MDRSVSDPLFGQLLDERYLVGSRIARGGMATVYEATDLRLDRLVALKIMPQALADDETFSQRFVREARAAARLTHPNVVAVYDQGEDAGVLFLAMEYVPGRHTLRDVIRDESPLPPQRALSILEEILKAIAAAHEAGLVHRDIKPENVLITPQGQVKVADFGLARAISSATAATATGGVLMGTVSYLPPELVTDGTADARADVYALGVLAFEMLTGAKPHTGDSPIQVAYKHVHDDVPAPSTLVDGIPPYLDAFVARATSRERDLRPADAHVMLHQLRRVKSALDAGILDDQELTDDLTPTLPAAVTASVATRAAATSTIAAPGGPPLPSADPAGGAADVFDISGYDDFVPTEIRPLGGGYGGVEQTLTVDASGPIDASPIPAPRVQLPPDAILPPPQTPAKPIPPPPFHPHNRRRGWIALLVVLLLAVGAGAAGWWYGIGRFESTPNVVGLSQTAAQGKIEDAGLTFKIDDTAYSETVPAGDVISTDPGPGDNVEKNGTISVIVSRGPERHNVPKLDGMSEDDARAAIESASLKVGRVDRHYNNDVPEGDVVSYRPDSGTALKRNAPVGLVISKGPKPVEISDFSGQRAKDVVHQLDDAGLTVHRHYHYNDDVAKGLVVETSPSNTTLFAGDSIDVYISKGPHLVEVPNVHFFGVDAAVSALTDAGFQVDQRDANVNYGLGFVVGQNPDGGSMAPYGSTVTIFIS
ncbi:MAG TPA: PASTA domain-containing protein [Nocardioidaceae bacterium]|nr:PASTA domain-containing protein [Nocardioidaceae bacterium]